MPGKFGGHPQPLAAQSHPCCFSSFLRWSSPASPSWARIPWHAWLGSRASRANSSTAAWSGCTTGSGGERRERPVPRRERTGALWEMSPFRAVTQGPAFLQAMLRNTLPTWPQASSRPGDLRGATRTRKQAAGWVGPRAEQAGAGLQRLCISPVRPSDARVRPAAGPMPPACGGPGDDSRQETP